MPSKRDNQGKSHVISPVLFITVEGEPMRFFLCPGPAKVELLPHIKAGGGMVCKAQEPGAVLLVDPNEMGALKESTAHWYVSAQYIRDCIEKNEQLELEDYRMKPDATGAQSTKKMTAKTSSTNIIPYTSKEDAAIISYVATRKDKLKGNLLWQEMETSHVTHHSWQSMKYRYIHKLMDRPTEAIEAQEEGRRNGVSKADDQQTDDPPMEAGSSESTNVEPPTAGSPPVPDVTPEEKEKEEEEEAAPPAGLPESLQHTLSPMRVDQRKTPQTKDVEKKGKRKEKRKLGILEMATKEFEDDNESDYEETPDLLETMNTQHPRETTSKHPTGTPDVPMETRTVVETGSTPKPHLFIFDSESQEEGSQSMDYEDAAVPAGPQQISKKAEVESLTQVQLKEDMQRIRELMKQTNQDLVSVTKALLKTSGDFSAALALLLNPDAAQGPFWSRCDDRLLLTSDPEARRQLQKRYGEQGVAKRQCKHQVETCVGRGEGGGGMLTRNPKGKTPSPHLPSPDLRLGHIP
ncbi:unnamed protein product [Lota lota]